MKTCSVCGAEKEDTEFYLLRSHPGRRKATCKACENLRSRKWAKENKERNDEYQRRARLQRKYKITVEDYDRLSAAQGGVCRICGKAEEGRALAVDHDHSTGKVRGLLCGPCNQAIGLLRDSPALIHAAADYLDEANGHG